MVGRVCVALVGLVVGTCGLTGAGLAGPAQKGGTLRLALPSDLDSVDPAVAYAVDSWMVEFATCATLYNYPDRPAPAGTTLAAEVATALPTVSKDGKTQTMELQRTYRFHTGERITAASFVAAFNRDANPRLQSPAIDYLHEIVGADAVIGGKAQTIAGVKALGPDTLQIRTTRPVPDLAYRLTMPFFCPIQAGTPLREIDDPPGSGPYYVASRVPNRQTVLERNRFYRGPRPANVDRVVLTANLGLEECRLAVDRDEQDDCEYLSDSGAREVVAEYGVNKGRVFRNPTLATNYFAFNHDRPAFKGPGQIPLAQAINWAIDRPALVRAGSYLTASRTDQILPPAITRNASVYPLGGVTEQHLARARALLAKAAFKPDTLVLYTSNSAFGANIAQVFQYNLKRLGIDVEIKYFTIGTLFQKMGTRGEPFDVGFGSWAVDYADPFSFFTTLLGGDNLKATGNTNIAYFDRPKYNREIERIEGLQGEARRKAWADLDAEMMRDDPPWAPYLNFTRLDFVSPSLGCFVFQPVVGRLDIAAACKK
jgi:peptide/nickel transport system substrate-binding protein